jgi:hypothetical protein
MPPSVRRGVCSRGRASTRTGRHFPPPSIFVEEPLNFLRAGRFCQRQRQQDGCLLRTQVVCDHHVGLVPIVVANDAPFSNPRALHHNGATIPDDLPKFFVEISWRTGSHTGDNDSFCAGRHQSVGKPGSRSGMERKNDQWPRPGGTAWPLAPVFCNEAAKLLGIDSRGPATRGSEDFA